MDWTIRIFAISILLLFLLIAGCAQESSVKEETFTTYSHPGAGFMMKYPKTWDINHTTFAYNTNQIRVTFRSPDNRASLRVDINPYHHPEGEEEGGVGLSYEVPNSTTIESFEKIQLAGIDGLKWTFLVENPDREYYDKFISITQKCPLLPNNRIAYFFNYDYAVADGQMEKTLQEMLDSINLTCPSMN